MLLLLTTPLLARGRDRLETVSATNVRPASFRQFPYSLGDAIDWKHRDFTYMFQMFVDPLLARGRDRLETIPRNG